jgi:exonuclease 3'-5' domain-containing protein 1
MKTAIETKVINTAEQIGGLVDWLIFRHAPPVPYSPTRYSNLEGVDLCREGSLSIITLLYGNPYQTGLLVDMHILGAQAFNTSCVNQKTLKDHGSERVVAPWNEDQNKTLDQ